VRAGAGARVEPDFTLEPGGPGAGGDTLPFPSHGGFRVAVSGGGCHTAIHRASDGSVVDELSGTTSSDITESGEFYVHTDPRCTTTVTPI
jgi:hypothetical protein